jgi:phosphatidylserine/phosphatidylglycerophosphate/cardiolipin synthase-like enzyme
MFSLLHRSEPPTELLSSKLYDGESFYPELMKDLNKCQHELLIESPFITNRRLNVLLPTLIKLKDRRVRVTINTRDPETHDDNEYLRSAAREAISTLQHMGVQVLFTGNHHRKLAIIDRRIMWEGSLNILSYSNSCEVMRRIESVQLAWQMIRFTKIDKYIH